MDSWGKSGGVDDETEYECRTCAWTYVGKALNKKLRVAVFEQVGEAIEGEAEYGP